MKSRFSKYNDGVLKVCESKGKITNFGAINNAREKSELKQIVKLAFEEKTKRENDIEFAISHDRTLSLKVKTRLHKRVNSSLKVIIENTLYSIIKIDFDRGAQEMYLYLEEERAL